MASLIEDLENTLECELDAYTRLLPVVKEKTGIIVKNNVSELRSVTEKEQMIVEEIMVLEKKREKIVKNIGIVLNKKEESLHLKSLADLLHNQPEDREKLLKLREELKKVASQVNDVNRHNENLIEQCMDLVSYSMNIIQTTRMVSGNNYTNKAAQACYAGSQTGMFDAKQ